MYSALCFKRLIVVLIISSTVYTADKPQYKVSAIPENLLVDADAVIRNSSTIIEVENEKKASISKKHAVTILNEKGQYFGRMYLFYFKFIEIENFEATLYDSSGNEIRKIDEGIKDYASISWAQLYSDWRYKLAELYHNEFPYTVEFTFKEKYNGYITWPSWIPEEENASVQYSSYEIILPKEFHLRYRCYNWEKKPAVSPQKNNNISYFWDAVNLAPFKSEPFGPPVNDQYKSVEVAPVKFKMDDYEGDLTTWQNFGLWIKELWKGRQKLPDDIVRDLNNMLNPQMSRKEKVCKVYNYLQSSTRYVDLTVGIGGWQPVKAEKVVECGYGDCKALSNYMIALLKAVGIESYPVLINSNSKPKRFDISFPSNQFNHAIVCVPEEADTIWLECTNQFIPCGYLGPMNENRYGLLISDGGGKLVKTPSSNAIDNRKLTKAVVDLEKGSAEISVKYSGNMNSYANYVYRNQSEDNYQKLLESELKISPGNVLEKNIKQIDGDTVCTILDAKVSIPDFVSTMGNRLFFSPYLVYPNIDIPEENEGRIYPVVFSFAYSEIDTILYKIPEGAVIEAKPEDITIETEYYKFISNVRIKDSITLSYIRNFQLKKEIIPKESYDAFRDFLQLIAQSDARKIVLKLK